VKAKLSAQSLKIGGSGEFKLLLVVVVVAVVVAVAVAVVETALYVITPSE